MSGAIRGSVDIKRQEVVKNHGIIGDDGDCNMKHSLIPVCALTCLSYVEPTSRYTFLAFSTSTPFWCLLLSSNPSLWFVSGGTAIVTACSPVDDVEGYKDAMLSCMAKRHCEAVFTKS